MLRRLQPLTQSAHFFCSKRALSTTSLIGMMNEAAELERQKKIVAAQKQYQKIMDTFPNYENAYKHYYYLEFEIGGQFSLTESLFKNLQKKYLEAVDKYGEYKEDSPASPKV